MAEQKKFIVKNGLIASGLTYPTVDGTANQLLKTALSKYPNDAGLQQLRMN